MQNSSRKTVKKKAKKRAPAKRKTPARSSKAKKTAAKKKTPEVDIIALARKKRHMFLIEKMSQGKALSRKELDELEGYENPDQQNNSDQAGIARTIPQLAAALGYTARTVRYWVDDGMPARADGSYDIETVRRWHGNRDNRRKSSDADEIERRLRQAQLQQVEFKIQREQGLYISREEARNAGFETARKTRDAMLAIPDKMCDKLASITDSGVIRTLLIEQITEALANLAKEEDSNQHQTKGRSSNESR